MFAINELDRRVRASLTAEQIAAYIDVLLDGLRETSEAKAYIFETSLTALSFGGFLTVAQTERWMNRGHEVQLWNDNYPPWEKRGRWMPADIVTPMPP